MAIPKAMGPTTPAAAPSKPPATMMSDRFKETNSGPSERTPPRPVIVRAGPRRQGGREGQESGSRADAGEGSPPRQGEGVDVRRAAGGGGLSPPSPPEDGV